MKADAASSKVNDIIETLSSVQITLDENDTLEFDIEPQLNTLADNAAALEEYVTDQ